MPRLWKRERGIKKLDKNRLHSLIRSFLAEDIGAGDLTAESIFSPEQIGSGSLIAREVMMVAGVNKVAAEVFKVQNPVINTCDGIKDGHFVEPGSTLLTVTGPVAVG